MTNVKHPSRSCRIEELLREALKVGGTANGLECRWFEEAEAALSAPSERKPSPWQRFKSYAQACGVFGRDGVKVNNVSFVYLQRDDHIAAMAIAESEADSE